MTLYNPGQGSVVLCEKKFAFGMDKFSMMTEKLQSVILIGRNIGMCFCKTNKAKKVATYIIPPVLGALVLIFFGLVIWILKTSD